FINPGVPADMTIPFRPQRDHSSRVPPRRLLVCASVDDRAGPFEVHVEIVSGIVDVPLPDARRPAPDLREPEPLPPGEPFHVGRGGSDLEYPDYVPRHLAYFGIAGRVDAIRRDHLGRDPALAHRLQHVRVVVGDEFMRDLAIDREGIKEAFMPFDELLD